MSFIIGVHVNEGIVLASDRRKTHQNNIKSGDQVIHNFIHTSDSTDKTFLCPNQAGISYCGAADLMDKPITGFIQNVIRERISPDCKVADMPQIIIDYFNEFSEVPDTTFIIAGYDTIDSKKQQIMYSINTKHKNIHPLSTSGQGAAWEGETHTLTRLIQNVAFKRSDGTYEDLPHEGILWNQFTLQDAVDFARYAVETTIQTMRFKNVRETVGGKVDILVITPDEAKWLQKETLK